MDEKTPLEPPPDYATSITQSTNAVATRPPPHRPHAPLPLNLPALNGLRGRRVILASASPRRRQLLAQIGLNDVEVIPSNAPENFPKTMTPFEYVLRTAESKALGVYKKEIDSPKGEPAIIIAADTVVVGSQGEILEKPRNERHHLAMLRSLVAMGWHKVYTAVVCVAPREDAVAPGYAIQTQVEETSVRFDPDITDDLITAYVRTREGADKAGGYGIQGMGAILVERIEGTHDNVVGLPLRVTLQLIEKVTNPPGPDDEDEDDV